MMMSPYIRIVITLLFAIFTLVIFGQRPSPCPNAADLAPYCNCSNASAASLFTLDCSGAETEDQLELIFSSTNFSESSVFYLLISNNRGLINLSRNVFGDVAFESIYFSNNILQYIDRSVFINSYSTVLQWEMRYCNLTPNEGFPFDSLSMYSKLETINLESTGRIDAFPNISSQSIQRIYIIGNEMRFISDNAFDNIPNLIELDLHYNNISSFSAGIFDYVPLLVNISFRANNIQQLVAGSFRNLEQLLSIDLGFTGLTVIEPESFLNLPKLERLNLPFNGLQGFLNDTLGNLPSLVTIYFSANLVEIIEPAAFLGCPLLAYVTSAYNQLTFISAGTFDVIKSGYLDLYGNMLTTLDESWLRTVLEGNSTVDIAGNPLECGCDIAWLYGNTSLMINLNARCSNNTDIHDLDPTFFTNSC